MTMSPEDHDEILKMIERAERKLPLAASPEAARKVETEILVLRAIAEDKLSLFWVLRIFDLPHDYSMQIIAEGTSDSELMDQERREKC